MASVKALGARPSRPRLVAFNADGSRLATCMADNRLKFWDAVAGRLLVECADVASRVSTDGQMLPLGADAAGGEDGGRGHLELRYSCMTWAERAQGEAEGKAGKEGKKRKNKGAIGAKAEPLVVLGTAYGDVIAWDVAMGAVAWQQNAVEPAGIVSLAFLPATAALPAVVYAAGADGYVSELNAADGAALARFRGSKSPVSTLAVGARKDDDLPALLMVGSSELKLYDAGSKTKIRKFSGHPGKISSIAFSPDASFAFTAAEGDRHVAVWDCSEASKKRTSFAVLPLLEPPEFVACAQGGGDEGSGFRVLALTGEGEAYVWAGATIPELVRAQPVVVKGERKVKGAGQGQARQGKKGREAIMAAHLLQGGGALGSSVIVARGILARPQFVSVSLDEAQDANEGEPRVILLSAPEATDLLPAGGSAVRAEGGEGHGEVEEQEEGAGRGKSGGKGGKKGRGVEAEDLGGVQVVGGMPMQSTVLRASLAEAEGGEGEKERKKKNKRKAAEEQAGAVVPSANGGPVGGIAGKGEGVGGAMAEGEERTLEEQLKALGIAPTGLMLAPAASRKPHSSALLPAKGEAAADSTAAAAAAAAPRAESLSVVVQQALEAGDTALLQHCFQAAATWRRRSMVVPTVRRLPPHVALKLVEVVAARVQEHPREAAALVPWMQAALSCHAGTLASAPAAHGALAALYQAVEARVAALRPMLELAGRLQLVVMAAREARGQGGDGEGGEGEGGARGGGRLERGGLGGGVRAATVYEEGGDSDVEVEDARGVGGDEEGLFGGEGWVEEDEEDESEEESEGEEEDEEEERFMGDEEGDLMEEDEEGEGEDEE